MLLNISLLNVNLKRKNALSPNKKIRRPNWETFWIIFIEYVLAIAPHTNEIKLKNAEADPAANFGDTPIAPALAEGLTIPVPIVATNIGSIKV